MNAFYARPVDASASAAALALAPASDDSINSTTFITLGELIRYKSQRYAASLERVFPPHPRIVRRI